VSHLRNVLDRFMTREQARTDYDVVIRDNLTPNHEATAALQRGPLDLGEPQAGGKTEAIRTLAMLLPG
jgi:hypothetical protein